MIMNIPPTIIGNYGCAWLAPVTDETRLLLPTATGTWLLHCPGEHPFWSWYIVSSCALRDVAGVRPAKVNVLGATHEILVIALNPDYVPGDGWYTAHETEAWGWHYMEPANLSEQVLGLTDADAAIRTSRPRCYTASRSTRGEIEYAERAGKPVRWLEPRP